MLPLPSRTHYEPENMSLKEGWPANNARALQLSWCWEGAGPWTGMALECQGERFRDLSSLLMSLNILTGSQKLSLGFDNEASVYDYENEVSE